MKVLMTILLAACVTGCLGNGGNIPHEDSEGTTPHNEGAPLCHDGTPPPCVFRNYVPGCPAGAAAGTKIARAFAIFLITPRLPPTPTSIDALWV
jgi:hypothetical protein